ncbi:MAG: PIN domain-containing protein [Armatimonadetes bacterium]|nr:PIN domain-containing protein [Armatimonadota bacterium]
MRADFPVVLDACVLAEAAVSDLFLRLSEEPRLLLPKWSETIWLETRRTWINRLQWNQEIADSRMRAAIEAFPEAMITGYEHVIPVCTNHPDDRHVLAAAIHAKVETIISFNVKDYALDSLEPWGITVAHPGDYLKVLYDHDPAAVTTALHAMADRAGRPLPAMLSRLAWYVRPFSEYVASALAVELADIKPADWRR